MLIKGMAVVAQVIMMLMMMMEMTNDTPTLWGYVHISTINWLTYLCCVQFCRNICQYYILQMINLHFNRSSNTVWVIWWALWKGAIANFNHIYRWNFNTCKIIHILHILWEEKLETGNSYFKLEHVIWCTSLWHLYDRHECIIGNGLYNYGQLSKREGLQPPSSPFCCLSI